MKKYLLLLVAGAIALPGLAIAESPIANESTADANASAMADSNASMADGMMADANASMADANASMAEEAFEPVYSQSISGNVRINHEQNTDGDVTTASTTTGGGDTYLQWNHTYTPSETKSVTGFIRFKGSGDQRINVTGDASEGAWTAKAVAEWEVSDAVSSTSTSVSTDTNTTVDANDDDNASVASSVSGGTTVAQRDVYVLATHASGLSVQLGRAAYLDTKRGTYADWSGKLANGTTGVGADDGFADALENRFNAFKVGYDMGNGVALSLLLQIDNSGNSSLFGFVDGNSSKALNEAADVSGNVFGLTYAGMGIDAYANIGGGSADGNKDRNSSDDGVGDDVSFTQLGASYDAGVAVPYFNMVSYTVDGSDGSTDTETAYSATLLGASAAVGGGTVMASMTNISVDDSYDSNGIEVGYVTTLGGVALKAAYGTGSYEPDGGDSVDLSYIGVRMEYGF